VISLRATHFPLYRQSQMLAPGVNLDRSPTKRCNGLPGFMRSRPRSAANSGAPQASPSAAQPSANPIFERPDQVADAPSCGGSSCIIGHIELLVAVLFVMRKAPLELPLEMTRAALPLRACTRFAHEEHHFAPLLR
jgi:hypothetical protein